MIQRKKKPAQDTQPDQRQITMAETMQAAPDLQDKTAIRAVEAIYSKNPLNSIYKTQDKISNLLPEIISSAETVPVEVETSPNSMVKVSIMSDKLLNFGNSGISIFDRAVLDGITACILQSATSDNQMGIFTLPQLIRAVTGKKAGQSGISEQQQETFLESVRKLMTMYLEIDMSNELHSMDIDGKPIEEISLTKVVGKEIFTISFMIFLLIETLSFFTYFFIDFCIIRILEISVNILNITIDITACIFDLDTANGKKIIIKIIFIISSVMFVIDEGSMFSFPCKNPL